MMYFGRKRRISKHILPVIWKYQTLAWYIVIHRTILQHNTEIQLTTIHFGNGAELK